MSFLFSFLTVSNPSLSASSSPPATRMNKIQIKSNTREREKGKERGREKKTKMYKFCNIEWIGNFEH